MSGELTLTGATLTETPHGHSHSHSHSHSQGHSCNHEDHQIEMASMSSPSIEEVVNAPTDEIVKTLSTLLRFGRFEALEPILEKLAEQKPAEIPTILSQMDEGGHSALHWAAKRVDDIRFLQSFLDIVEKNKLASLLNAPSSDNVGMTPLHWACTESSIPHVALLWKKGADVEARDASGCTPLLIASQYGQVEVVAYLLKNGANIQAVDSSRDTALHWAAYKGSIQVCGLLAFYQTLNFGTRDAYGQTPLHLGALRGHTSIVRYILLHLPTKKERDILFLKDKNDRTPLDLAIHKNRPNVQVVLKEAMAAAEDPRGHFLRKTMWTNLQEAVSPKAWKQWMGMSAGADEIDEPVKFPFYYVVGNFVLFFLVFFGSFAPLLNAGKGLLWDKSGWLLWNIAWMILTWYTFYKTWKTSPGYLDATNPNIDLWRRRYEETLEAYAEGLSPADAKKHDSLPPLCHTCHVARPHRSKHCRVSRKCVLLFDHYCPFVDNTIGLNNYKFFYSFLISMSTAIFCFGITLIMFVRRHRQEHGGVPWATLLIGIEICICILPVGGLCLYHTQLSMVNLSTNEHMNVRKYKYLYSTVNGRRRFRNPWFKGWFGNVMDRMQPSDASYMIPVELEPLQGGLSGDEAV